MRRKYEIGFVVNPEASEEDVKKIIDLIVGIIKKHDGNIENIDEWGRRKFAYPIEKHNEGIYIFINAEMAGTGFIEIERRFALSEKVMRFIVLRLDDKLKKANRLTKKWKRMEKLSRRAQEARAEASEREESSTREREDNRNDREVNDAK